MKITDVTLRELAEKLKESRNARSIKEKEDHENLRQLRIRIEAIIDYCDEGIIDRPKGIWILRCPKCKSKLQVTNLYVFKGTSYRTPMRHKYCVCLNEHCEYEYATQHAQ